jgi:hypothetical protein
MGRSPALPAKPGIIQNFRLTSGTFHGPDSLTADWQNNSTGKEECQIDEID